MAIADDRLRSLWTSRKRQPPFIEIDEMAFAAWIDSGCPENEAMEALLSEDPLARESLSHIRLHTSNQVEDASSELIESLRSAVSPHLSPVSTARSGRSVIGSIGIQTAAAVAAIVVAALGFTFGQTAAPATNEAASNFAAAVTFDLLESELNDLESIVLATATTTLELGKDARQ